MDRLFWTEIWEVAIVNFLIPFVPWLWTTRAAITAAAAASQPWWIVLIVANLAGLPSLLIMIWIIRHGHTWLSRRWPQFSVPMSKHGPTLTLFLLSASPLPEYVTALYAGTLRGRWIRLCLTVIAGRTIHHAPIVLSGVFLGQHPWFRTALEWARHPLAIVITALIGLIWYKLHTRRSTTPQTIP